MFFVDEDVYIISIISQKTKQKTNNTPPQTNKTNKTKQDKTKTLPEEMKK